MKKQNKTSRNSKKAASVKLTTLKPLNSMVRPKSFIPLKVRSLKAVLNRVNTGK